MATADTQALQQLINKISELKAQIAEAEVAKEKLDHRMAEALVAGAEPGGAMFDQMKKNFFDPTSREIEELKQELRSIQQEIIKGGQLALPAPSGQLTTDSGSTRARNIAAAKSRIQLESTADSSGTFSFEEQRRVFDELERAVPKASGAIAQFMETNRLAMTDLDRITTDKTRGIAGISGQFEQASGAIETFNYTVDAATGLRTYSGEIEHTNGIVQKFSETMDSTGKTVTDVNKEGFNPSNFRDYGKQAGKLLKTIGDLGFKTTDLKDVQEEASTNIRRYTLAARDSEGVMRRATITTDKWGNILQDTQKRFRGFFSTIARNTAEVLKWTVAVQLTYKPLLKMYELIEVMVENEAKLADITIALGESYESLNDIFRIASDVATETGSSIKGVLEGYELAYRATGGIIDATERAAAAQQLLVDSMLLSKVSTLDQATALDTLAGGLLQIGEPLDSGQQLLDKWVAVSKRANVSIKTLAESFAITASSAKNAGLSLDELNGIIAVVAENTTLSATEAGNAVRAFISGFQTDTAVRELTKFGVLVRDSSQQNLEFLDVMYQVKNLFDAGLISDSQLNEVAEAIGGGARRGAQVVAFLKNLDRVQEVATASSLAQGDAQEALAIKMETLKTKTTELENAFVRFGQALGTEGGLISGAKLAIESFTGILNIITSLTDALGTAIPVMIAYGVAMAQVNKIGGITSFRQQAALGLGVVGQVSPNKGLLDVMGVQIGKMFPPLDAISKNTGAMKQSLGKFVAGPGFGAATGLALTGIMAAGSLIAGETERAAGQAIGGSLIAVLTGSPIGALIGASIGGAFTDYVYGQEPQFRDFFAGLGLGGDEDDSPDEIGALQKAQQDLTDAIIASSGIWRASIVQAISQGYKAIAPKKGQDLTQAQAALVSLERQDRGGELDVYLERLRQLKEQESILSGEITESLPLYKTRNALIEENKGLIERLTQEYKDLAFEERLAGDITNKQFNEINQILASLGINVGGYVAAFGGEFKALSADVNTTAQAFESLTLALTHGNEADISYLSGLLVDVAQLQDQLGEPGADTAGIEQKILDTQVKGAKAIELILKNIQRTAFKLPTMIEMFGLTQKEADAVVERAEYIRNGIDREVADAGLGERHTEEEFKNIFGEIMLRVGQHGGTQLVEGLSEANIKEAMAELAEEGRISIEETFGLMDFSDLTTDQFNQLAAESVRLGNLAQEQTGGALELNWKTFGAITNDAITGPVTAELTLLQALMKDLIEVNEDQAEGIYNLPTDGTFFVPFEGYQKGFGGGGGGLSGDFINKFEAFLNAFPKPEEVQDVFVTNQEGYEPVSGYVPEKTIEDYMGEILGPPAPDPRANRPGGLLPPQEVYDTRPVPVEEPFRPLGQNFDSIINMFSGLGDTFTDLWNDILTGLGIREEEILSSGGGAGGADIVEGLKGLKSLEELVAYFTSGGFYDDAMKDSPDTTTSFNKVLEILQGLGDFSPYGEDGEGPAWLDSIRDLFGLNTEQPDGQGNILSDSVSDLAMATQQLNETGQLALTLEINSDTNLTLDSQVIGVAVKQFVYEEMLKREGASSSATTKTFTM